MASIDKNVYDLLFANASTDTKGSCFVCDGVLCLSAGTTDRFTKERLEARLAEGVKIASGKTAKAEIKEGFEALKADYDEKEAAEGVLSCVFTVDGESFTSDVPVKVFVKEIIYDNDLGSDCDDGGATAMLVRAHRDGYCKLLAVTTCVNNPWTPMCFKKIFEYFGVYDIEIGENRDRDQLDQHYWYACSKEPAIKFYGEEEYPTFESNVPLIRRLLANSHGDVTVITTGALSTLYPLMESEGDEYSPLTGDELFRKTVGHYVCGGGVFPKGTQESNFLQDPTAVDMVINRYLSGFPITFVGAEVSGIVRSSTCLKGREDYILLDIYRHCDCAVMNNFENEGYWSWDQGVVYYALHATQEGLFGTVDNCTAVPYRKGGLLKLYTDCGCHRYVVRKASTEVLAAIYNVLMVP